MPGCVCNPYLPLWEYVPDGEPRIFGDRLYIYGSHDRSGGDFFCLEDYVVWSAPLEDLTDWRCEGVSYRREQDPHNAGGKWELFAPDVVRGADGRYYLFYCLRMQKEFGVAVSDSPAGPFAFYCHLRRRDGSLFDSEMPYDPSVLVDSDGRVYLYYGYTSEAIAAKFGAEASGGCMVVELSADLRTVLTQPKVCLPRDIHTAGTGFEGHGYYEAPSMRKFGDTYYLVYSSEVCHELCYGYSDRPDGGFSYGGVLVSNGDVGLKGRRYPVFLLGNNHGGLVEIQGQYYIFYQRHTRGNQFSRQGCAEKIWMDANGRFAQVELTSCGLNQGPLPAEGVWSAAICCHLTDADPEKMLRYRVIDPENAPCIWEEPVDQPDRTSRTQFVRHVGSGTTVGFKYFHAGTPRTLAFTVRGQASGVLELLLDDPEQGERIGTAAVTPGESWHTTAADGVFSGTHALYLVYRGEGTLDLRDIRFDG